MFSNNCQIFNHELILKMTCSSFQVIFYLPSKQEGDFFPNENKNEVVLIALLTSNYMT